MALITGVICSRPAVVSSFIPQCFPDFKPTAEAYALVLHAVHCILTWSQLKEVPSCPQCKTQFNYLYVYRMLDGTLSDHPVEESVCLLKRAQWYVERMNVQAKGKAVSAAMAAAGATPGLPDDYDFEEEDYEDPDDEIEAYYFSGAAGRARVVIGNRRGGENGFIRGGRMLARPALNAPATSSKKQQGSSAAAKGQPAPPQRQQQQGGAGSSRPAAASAATPAANAASSGDPGSKGQGRRAARNARRVAVDDEYDCY